MLPTETTGESWVLVLGEAELLLSQEDYRSPSFCGNSVVEDGEECDCGLTAGQCDDPCCYPGLLTAAQREVNVSARPCHSHTSPLCTQPWRSPVMFALVWPWTFIFSLVFLLVVILAVDWRKNKELYLHLAPYHPVSRGEETSGTSPGASPGHYRSWDSKASDESPR